jgi:hypothetical protein
MHSAFALIAGLAFLAAPALAQQSGIGGAGNGGSTIVSSGSVPPGGPIGSSFSGSPDEAQWEAQKAKLRKNSVVEASKTLDSLIPNVPGSGPVRNLIRDYQSVLRPEAYADPTMVGATNAGLNQLTRAFGSDPQLAARIKAFYVEVATIDMAEPKFKPDPVHPLGSRANLSQVAGDAEHPGLKPGWLLQLALKHAGADGNLALRMIGVCGHDDVTQSSIPVPVPVAERDRRYREQVRFLSSSITDLEKTISKTPRKDPQRSVLEEYLRGAKRRLDSTTLEQFATEPLHCPPQDSAFYLPRSLGPEFDVPDDLKGRIVKAQAPSDLTKGLEAGRKPGASIPSKYYHVYGAALVACEMIARGHSPTLVSSMSRLLGYAYRTERMTTTAGTSVPPVADGAYGGPEEHAEGEEGSLGLGRFPRSGLGRHRFWRRGLRSDR